MKQKDHRPQNVTDNQLMRIMRNLVNEEEENPSDQTPSKLVAHTLPVHKTISQPPLDVTIHVKREVPPPFLRRIKMKKLVHPEFECEGPVEYSLSKIVFWRNDQQRDCKSSPCKDIYNELIRTNALVKCANLQDGFAILKRGVAVYRRFFQWNKIFLWKSVMQDLDGRYLYVPYLTVIKNKVVVRLRRFDYNLGYDCPALQFNK